MTTSKKPISPSELRRGYFDVLGWALETPRKPANIAFTEGDCRVAAQLIEEYEASK